jgi:hypothetical protein
MYFVLIILCEEFLVLKASLFLMGKLTLDYKHFSGTNYALNPRYHCILIFDKRNSSSCRKVCMTFKVSDDKLNYFFEFMFSGC